MQEDLHCSHCVVGCGYHQAMTHNSGQFWLVPKALEEQAFVILATKPETGLAYPLDVKGWKYKRHISKLTRQVICFARSVCKTTIKLKRHSPIV